MTLGEECSAWERWPLQYGEWLSTGILAAVPSVLSTEPPAPDTPKASLFHSTLPLLEPRICDCKWNFVHWSLKRFSDSLGISPWQTETLRLSQLDVICVPFGLWSCRLWSPAWALDPTFSRRTPPHKMLKCPSGTPPASRESPASPLVTPLHCLPVFLGWSGFFSLSMVIRLLSS